MSGKKLTHIDSSPRNYVNLWFTQRFLVLLMYGKLHIKHPTAIIIRPETFRTRSDGSIYRLIKRPIAIPNSIPAFALSFISTPQTPTCMFPMYQSMTLIYHRLFIEITVRPQHLYIFLPVWGHSWVQPSWEQLSWPHRQIIRFWFFSLLYTSVFLYDSSMTKWAQICDVSFNHTVAPETVFLYNLSRKIPWRSSRKTLLQKSPRIAIGELFPEQAKQGEDFEQKVGIDVLSQLYPNFIPTSAEKNVKLR